MSKIFLSLNNENVFSGIFLNETYWHNDISNFQIRRLNTKYLEWAIILLGWYIILSAIPNLWIIFENYTNVSRPLKVMKTRKLKVQAITSFPHKPIILYKALLDTGSQRALILTKFWEKQHEQNHLSISIGNNLKVKPPVIPKITRSMTQIRQQPPLKPASKRDGKGTALNSCQRAASVAVIKEKEFFQPHANIHPLKFDSLEIEQQLHQESVSKSDEKVTTRKRCQHAAPVADLKEKDSIQSRAEFPSSEYKLWEVIQQQTQESASKRKKGASRKKRQRVARIAALKGKKISRSQIVIPLSEDDNWEDEKIEVEWDDSYQTIIKNNEMIMEWKRKHQEWKRQGFRGGLPSSIDKLF